MLAVDSGRIAAGEGVDAAASRWRHPGVVRSLRALGISLAALAAGVILWLHAAGPGAHAGTDFHEYLDGARAILAGTNPYHRLAVAPDATGGLRASGYVYPPLLAVVLAALLRVGLPDGALWVLWNLLGAALTVAAGRALWQAGDETAANPGKRRDAVVVHPASDILRRSFSDGGAWLTALALIVPAVATYDLFLGQADVIMAALAVLAFAAWARGGRWSAALAAGVAIAVKPTLIVVPLVWLWQGDWRGVGRALGVAAVLVAGPFLLAGPGALPDFLVFTTHWNALGSDADLINQSLYGLVLRGVTTGGPTRPLLDAPALVWPLRIALVGGAAALWAWAVPRQRSPLRDVALAERLLVLPLALLVSPLAEDIHYCLLTPALVALALVVWRRRPPRPSRFWGLAVGALLASGIAFCLPRFQEIISPDRWLALPGQSDPHIGWLIVLARSDALVALAALTLAGGAVVVRAAQVSAADQEARRRNDSSRYDPAAITLDAS